jgi:uncharacterized RDD family membrane protein YckC
MGAVRIASVGRRLLARAIDSIIYFVVYGFLLAVGVASLVVGVSSQTPNCTSTSDGEFYCGTSSAVPTAGWIGFALAWLVALAFGLLYQWLMVGLWGATIGKMIVGIRARESKHRQDHWPRAGIREGGYSFSWRSHLLRGCVACLPVAPVR